MKKRLITSALPYVNNIPHLGNLIQVLSADVFARFCRLRGYPTLYVCATDEYGTATETRAREEGISPKELCDRYHRIHREIYDWFTIQFDHFGRTSCPSHTTITQQIFSALHAAGYITEHSERQLYSESADMFLADRYVRGTCPHCGYGEARGDQCEQCGALLDPAELIEPRSVFDNSTPVLRETTHLYINLPAILPKLEAWMHAAAGAGKWAKNAVQMTQAWIRDGLRERAITRDLKWGIPVPLAGFENKVFYVWFDAPIGYISVTAEHQDDWRLWWQNPDNVELFQFIGKDNIPFHTVIFPSSLLGSGERWTMLHHMSSSEYLNYESGKFSKSKGVGVFGTDVRETGIPVDVWRFYLYYNRPETADYVFTWKDLQEKANGELMGNFSNLVHRTLSFVERFFAGRVPAVDADHPESIAFWAEVRRREAAVTAGMEWAGIRDAFRGVFELSSFGNKAFQEGQPWKTRVADPPACARLIANLMYLIKDLTILTDPFLPTTSATIRSFLGLEPLTWNDLGQPSGLTALRLFHVLFKPIEDAEIESLRQRFAGSQDERDQRRVAGAGIVAGAEAAAGAEIAVGGGAVSAASIPAAGVSPANAPSTPPPAVDSAVETVAEDVAERFVRTVRLKVAKIVEIERHPKADKLYIEHLDDGSGRPRTIVSGLVPYYAAEDLAGRHIIVVDNLKPAKLRGTVSEGMLLAASNKGEPVAEAAEPGVDSAAAGGGTATEQVEVIFADAAAPGTLVGVGDRQPSVDAPEIAIDTFFEFEIRAKGGRIVIDNQVLTVDGRPLTTVRVPEGSVG